MSIAALLRAAPLAALLAVPALAQSSGTDHHGDHSYVQSRQQAEVILIPSDAGPQDYFGEAVSISGDRVLVGAWGDAGDRGSAYVFVRSGDNWLQEGKLTAADPAEQDFFGLAVSLSGDRALIGVEYRDGVGKNSGVVYVFAFDGTSWLPETVLTADDAASNDRFGRAVSFSGNRALIGAPREGLGGSAYVFDRVGETWTQTAKITPSDIAQGDGFGWSVSLSGNRALIGSVASDEPGRPNSGAAYVFVQSNGQWVQEARLRAADAAADDQFGSSVSISGDQALIGATNDDELGSNSGSVYAFARSGSTWTQEAKLTASDGTVGGRFGQSLSFVGDRALVGANLAADQTSTGAAYLFDRASGEWTEEVRYTPSDGGPQDEFGKSVSLSENFALVGSPRNDAPANNSGAAYLFDLPIQVGAEDGLADGGAIGRVSPNPARSLATVRMAVAEAQHVRADVFNVLGQRVATVLDGPLAPGATVAVPVETSALPAGSYIVRIVGETFVESRRLTVVR